MPARTEPTAGGAPRLLIVSFSEIAADARVLKQVRHFAERGYLVTTCGFGAAPAEACDHVEVSPEESRRQVLVRAALLRLHWYRLAYWSTPYVRAARDALRGRAFDAVLANDLDTAGLALALSPAEKVHLDLHEYWPGRDDNNEAWVRLRQPYMNWQLRRYASRARSVTTVSDTIARRYGDEFGIVSGTVTNASPLRDFDALPVASPIRLVHSGASRANRRIEDMMRGVAASSLDATLDLYLTGQGTPYYESLARLAEELGDRVRLLPPVPQDRLVETLHAYDVGIHLLPPTNTNNALALPNKFFDYVQARLAIVIGPTASMAELLRSYELGLVTDDFSVEAFARALDGLDAEQVTRFKRNSDAAAEPLSAEVQNEVWGRAVAAILAP